MKYRIVARHKPMDGVMISESVRDDNARRFVATIRGWRNWLLYDGRPNLPIPLDLILQKAREIRDRIDSNDESVFQHGKTAFVES